VPLNDDDKRRYARHIMLDEIGEAGQEVWRDASVLVIGAGGLGSAVISYLTAAGIGRIGIADGDHVESSNLQRQILHEEGDAGRLKVESAADRISELNSSTAVDLYPRRITAENATSILARYDIIADGCDNFQTRFAVNAACFSLHKPLVSAAVRGFDGQLSTFAPHLDATQPCYKCLIPDVPPEANTCREVGVIGPLCGIIGSMQALEVLKYLVGLSTLTGTLLRYNGRTHRQTLTTLPRDPACAACAHR